MVVNFLKAKIHKEVLVKDFKRLGSKITEVKRVYRGLNSLVFRFGQKYVLKINPDCSEEKFRNEENLVKILRGNSDLKLSRILEIGTKKGKPSYSYMLTENIPGKDLIDQWDQFSEGEKKDISFELGKILAVIHSLNKFGNFAYGNTLKSLNRQSKNWQGFLKLFSKGIFRKANEIGSVDRKLLEKVGNFLKKSFDPTFMPKTKRLIHGDFHFANVRVNRGKIVGLFDFENSTIGDPEFEYFLKGDSEFAFPIKNSHFLKGYKSSRRLSGNFEKKRRYYLALHLVNICSIAKEVWRDKKRHKIYLDRLKNHLEGGE